MCVLKCPRLGTNMLEDRVKWSDVHTLFCVTGTRQTDMGETGDVAFKDASQVLLKFLTS